MRQADFIKSELEWHITRNSKKRLKHRAFAFSIKFTAVAFAAIITVLLGLKTDKYQETLKNAALVLGASITFLNTIDAFADNRGLWLRSTITLARLQDLKRDFEFHINGKTQNEITEDELSDFLKRLNHLLQDDLNSWLKLREDDLPREKSEN